MKVLIIILAVACATFGQDGTSPLVGTWDLDVKMETGTVFPSWLEIEHSGVSTYVGRFVGRGGSARPISRVTITSNSFSFAIPAQWEPGKGDLATTGELRGDVIVGTITMPSGTKAEFTGRRAPKLDRPAGVVWDKAIRLIDGSGLGSKWVVDEGSKWQVANGILSAPGRGPNVKTKQLFSDLKLHVEFRVPKDSNSGVYLRGRYEVQIEDSYGQPPALDRTGAVYGFLIPNENASKPPGEWQSMDITLIGRLVTIVLNGRTVICSQTIPGITGGSLDSKEAEPGPILLQGDHGPIEYRNVIVTPVLKNP